MKKKKFLILLLVILVLSSVICVTAVATLDIPNVVKAIYKVDRDTPATKEIELPEETEVKDSNLSKFNDTENKYKESVVYTEDKVRDIYTDEKSNEFI